MRAIPSKVHLQGDKVFLRNLVPEDISPAYVDWMNDREVVQFTESRFGTHSPDSVRAFVETCAANPSVLLLGIFDNQTSLHIGNIKLGPVDWHHLLADIGIIVGRKEYWGRGVAAESIVLLRDYAFADLGLHKLTAGCYVANVGSERAFEKAGFAIEARLPRHAKCGEERVDVLRFGCLRPDVLSSDTVSAR